MCHCAGLRVRKLQGCQGGELLGGGAGAEGRGAAGGGWGIGGAYLGRGLLTLSHVLPVNGHTNLEWSFGVSVNEE